MSYGLTGTNLVEPLSILNPNLVQGFHGQSYNFQLNFNGGYNGGATWSSTGTLPPGLNLSNTGLISGTPTTPGTYPFTITATDSINQTASANVQLVIN